MKAYATNIISSAYELTRKIVLPFDWKKWILLAIITFFVGQAGFSIPNISFPDSGPAGIPDNFLIILIPLIIIGVIFALVFMYLHSVFSFVLFDAIRQRKPTIRKSYNANHPLGMSYFFYKLSMFAIAVGVFLVFGGAAFLAYSQSLALTIGVAAIGVLLLVLLAIFDYLVSNIVIVAMFDRKKKFVQAFRMSWPAIRSQVGEVLLYWLMRIVLGIVTGILSLMIFIALVLLVLIIAAILFGIGALLYLISSSLLWPLIIVGILLAIPLLLILIVAMAVFTMPFPLFFGVYKLMFARKLLGIKKTKV